MISMDIIVDLQFGSTGKGLLAGYMAKRFPYDTIVTAWAPNAGHTYVSDSGKKYVHRSLPNGVVGPNVRRIMIGPGSVIDPVNFREEYFKLADEMRMVDVHIHPHASVVTDKHRTIEASSLYKIGSTMKGVSAAMIQKLQRDPDNLNTADALLCKDPLFASMLVSEHRWNVILEEQAERILIEGAQGYSLSINHGFYPYTTSRDCTVQQLLADCGIPYGLSRNVSTNVYGVARTFPIRVANRYDQAGNQIGTSGPCYWDQREITWDEIQQPVELTTVTKLPRRIFTWSKYQIQQAIRANGVTAVFLNFCNYVRDENELMERANDIREGGARVLWWGYGPADSDVKSAMEVAHA